jgi:hypothetical protein
MVAHDIHGARALATAWPDVDAPGGLRAVEVGIQSGEVNSHGISDSRPR